jgi:predicted P-loop ATPase
MDTDSKIYSGLTSYALINLDEFVIKDAQQPLLKYLLSTHDVKMRPPYGRVEEQRKRYASFIATTNNEHPLVDPTGSRRFVCVKADVIDNKGIINHDQIFAQAVEALHNRERYWFTDKETEKLMEYNLRFQKARDFATMVNMLFAKPEDTPENAPWMSMEEIMLAISKSFPKVSVTNSSKVSMGRTLTELGYERKRTNTGQQYQLKNLG